MTDNEETSPLSPLADHFAAAIGNEIKSGNLEAAKELLKHFEALQKKPASELLS